MRISLHYLKGYLTGPFPSPDRLVRLFSEIGIECEEFAPLSRNLEGWVTAEVRSVVENGEEVRVTLSDGSKVFSLPSRDSTLKVGEIVALFPSPDDPRLGTEWGLGIGGEDRRVLRLSPRTPPGTPLVKLFPEDFLFDLSITPNRGDLLSYIGIARDLSAKLGLKLNLPPLVRRVGKALKERKGIRTLFCESFPDAPPPRIFGSDLRIEDPDALRYGLLELILSSPFSIETPREIRFFLGRSGIRTLHPLVDLTHFVLLEIGQPMHVFDRERIKLPLAVRPAREGEILEFLDGRTRTFRGGELLIADAQGPQALAGVMGGKGSGVGEGTCSILLESAWFSPPRVMRARRDHGITTESSYRFERGTDPLGVELGILRFYELLRKLAGKRLTAKGIRLEVRGKMPPPRRVFWDREKALAIAGALPKEQEVRRIFRSLGLSPAPRKGGGEGWDLPTHRPDIKNLEDLVEEVLRIWGYDRVPATLPSFSPAPLSLRSDLLPLREERFLLFRHALCDWLVSQGFFQGIHLSFAKGSSSDSLERIRILNPLSEEEDSLRPSLLFGLLKASGNNLRHGITDLKLFEIGSVFFLERGKPNERFQLGILLSGVFARGFDRKDPADFFDLKGIVGRLLRFLRLESYEFLPPHENPLSTLFEPDRCLEVSCTGVKVGILGTISWGLARTYELEFPPLYAELDLEALFRLHSALPLRRFSEIPRHPAVERDFSFLYPLGEPAGALLKFLSEKLKEEIQPLLCESIELFDYYRWKELENHVSLGIRIRFRHPLRTLTQEEIDRVSRLLIELAESQGARLRGKERTVSDVV